MSRRSLLCCCNRGGDGGGSNDCPCQTFPEAIAVGFDFNCACLATNWSDLSTYTFGQSVICNRGPCATGGVTYSGISPEVTWSASFDTIYFKWSVSVAFGTCSVASVAPVELRTANGVWQYAGPELPSARWLKINNPNCTCRFESASDWIWTQGRYALQQVLNQYGISDGCDPNINFDPNYRAGSGCCAVSPIDTFGPFSSKCAAYPSGCQDGNCDPCIGTSLSSAAISLS